MQVAGPSTEQTSVVGGDAWVSSNPVVTQIRMRSKGTTSGRSKGSSSKGLKKRARI